MNAIPPTTVLAGLAASSRGATPVHVEHVGPEVARLSSNTILNGTVVSRAPDGAVHIRTDHGALVIRTPMRLPDGASVKVQLQITGNQTRAVVLSVDPRPAQPAPPAATGAAVLNEAVAAPEARPSAAMPAGPQTPAAGAAAPLLRPGMVVTAQMVQPAVPQPAGPTGGPMPVPSPAPHAAQSAPAPASSQTLTLRVIDVVPAATAARPASPAVAAPATPAMPQPGVQAAASTPTSLPGSTAPLPGPAAPPAPATPPPARAVAARQPVMPGQAPQAATPAGVPPTPAAAASSGPPTAPPLGPAAPPPAIVSGNVMAHRGDGQTYLATPLGRLSIPAAGALPPNSIVRFQVVAAPAAQTPAPMATPAAPASSVIELARGWPALQELTQTLAAANAPLAAQLADAVIPSAGPKLAQTMLFFMTALRLGDIGNWLGTQNAAALRASAGGELMARITDEFQQIARLSSESNPNDWRAFLVPIHDGDRLQQLRLFHRHYGGDGTDDADAQGDRFLIDLDLSRLGPMQLDGLLQANRFSLILRTDAALDAGAREDLRALFRDGCACAGLAGEISFAGARDFIPLPLDAVTQAAGPMTA